MPPVSKPSLGRYDFIVIGGGSGGMGASVSPLAFVLRFASQTRDRDAQPLMERK